MIRSITDKDLFEVNDLLQIFNVKYDSNTYNKDFRNILVYELDNKIIGVLIYLLIYDRVEIEYIVVDTEYKRKGIGSKLLNAINLDNIRNITLEVRESNKEAINFYKNNGFDIVTIRKNYYNNEDGYLMIKKLGE